MTVGLEDFQRLTHLSHQNHRNGIVETKIARSLHFRLYQKKNLKYGVFILACVQFLPVLKH